MIQAIQLLQSKSTAQHPSTQQVNHSPPMDLFLVSTPMDIFQSLINNLDSEGRYLFLNAVANQLRYPNNHTHYFSFVLLYLFAEAKQVRFIISSSCISISFMSNRYWLLWFASASIFDFLTKWVEDLCTNFQKTTLCSEFVPHYCEICGQ